MTEFQAAILLAQLGRLESQALRREKSAAILDERLSKLAGVRLIRREPRMTRRSYHMYILRLDEREIGVSRDRFVEALNAEGMPASRGWYHPLYANRLFRSGSTERAHGIISPLSDRGVDYSNVRCPVTEQVCRDAIWIPQTVLASADPAAPGSRLRSPSQSHVYQCRDDDYGNLAAASRPAAALRGRRPRVNRRLVLLCGVQRRDEREQARVDRQ